MFRGSTFRDECMQGSPQVQRTRRKTSDSLGIVLWIWRSDGEEKKPVCVNGRDRGVFVLFVCVLRVCVTSFSHHPRFCFSLPLASPLKKKKTYSSSHPLVLNTDTNFCLVP